MKKLSFNNYTDLCIRVSISLALFFILIDSISAQYQQQWVKKYSGTLINGADYGNSIAVDKQNNVYIAGYMENEQTSYDYFLVKYNSQGNIIWNKSYNGSINNGDFLYSLAVDDFGNAYVTGSAKESGTGVNCVTIKYDSSGNFKWIDVYDFGVGLSDHGIVVKIFNNKSIYVCGECTIDESESDLLLIKIDSSGTREWVRRNRGRNFDNIMSDMVLDKSNNVYITGGTLDMSSGWNFYLIKYSSFGDSLWSVIFDNNLMADCSKAITIDSTEDICITGNSIKNFTYDVSLITLKISPTGVLKWYNTYQNNLSSYVDDPVDIGVDKNNYIYVTGYTCIGQDLWTNRDFLTIRYKPNGDTSWTRKYNGPGNNSDWPYALTIDGQCNVYITGGSSGLGSSRDCFTVSYDTSGNTIWSNRYNGSANSVDFSQNILLDNTQNIIITGTAYEIGMGYDIVTIKYNKNVGINNNNEILPANPNLYQNYPNPFNPSTTIEYSISKENPVSIIVYDIAGREVETLVNEVKRAGYYTVQFNASRLSSGIYFYRITAGDFVQTKKMVLIK